MIRSLAWSFAAWMLGVIPISVVLAAGDPQAGQVKFAACAGCHAIPGYANAYPSYRVPRLGGQHSDYVAAALKAYQAGERQHPTMRANAVPLTEQDIQDIAAYVAGFTAPPPPQSIRGNPVAGQARSVACMACHGLDGNSPLSMYPRLAGQYEDYLRQALSDYQTGARRNPIMQNIAAALSAQDIADLAAWFASQPHGLITVQRE